jgi:hypothetical protein
MRYWVSVVDDSSSEDTNSLIKISGPGFVTNSWLTKVVVDINVD